VSASTAGRWSLPVEILVDGTPYRTVWVSLDVELYRTVPVLVRDVPAGAELGLADVAERRVLVSGPIAERPLSALELAGSRARRTLARGLPVGAHDVIRVAAIKKGETANLTVRNGGVLVNAKVIALEDAHVGELVAVRVLNSNKDLSAEVIGKGQLRLDIGARR
jgi:flagella basal body P-ring formation protein FlgA